MAPQRDEQMVESELLPLLIHSLIDYAIFALGPDGRVLTWNPGAERLKGYSAEEIVGEHFSRFYPAEDIADDKPERELAIAVADGQFEVEAWRIRSDGTRFWANVVITALRGDDGRLVGFGTVTRDLTERKRGEDALRESEERFRLLVSGVADYAIFLLNPDGTIASWNLGAERLKGYRADEIVGQHFSRFYTDEDRRAGLPQTILHHALEHGRWESEGWRLRKDGSRFWANVVVTALHSSSGEHRGFTKVTRDLTERKRGEDALRGVLARERESAARLRELDQMKNELVAVIAHDLHSPVAALTGLLDVLTEDWETSGDDTKLELISRIESRVARLDALVDDVLDVARIEAGELSIRIGEIDLSDIASQVVAEMAMAFPDRTIALSAGPSYRALGDERRVWQILTNLVSNALKFSAPDTSVAVELVEDADEVVIAVIDRGPGIVDEDLPQIFDRFVRLASSARVPGTGIGLFIAKSLAEAQAGRIWVDSTPGVGSTFRFALPTKPS